MNEILFSSAAHATRMIREKHVSSEEVVTAALDRIAEVNSRLNAVVQLDSDRAISDARLADRAIVKGATHGPLHGVPMTIKDSFDTAGIVSTGGTLGRASFVPSEDAVVVDRLRKAGAIIVGKSNTPELTMALETDNEVYGRTNNPFDLARTPGGSSGGAAAIIAAGGSFLDIGSDTVGSIRIPAHNCGIVGVKPTSGRVPRTGHIVPFGLGPLDSLTALGPMARHVEDLALCLPVVSGVDWTDPAIVPMPLGAPDSVDLGSLRIAFFTDDGIASPTSETVKAVTHAADLLTEAVACVEQTRPSAMTRSLEVFSHLWEPYASSWKQKLLLKAGTVDKIEPQEASKTVATMTLADLSEEVDAYRSEMLGFMKDYDVVVCPVIAHPAMHHGGWQDRPSDFSYVAAFNLTGWPVVVVRVGTSLEGLPIGAQIVGRPWNEHHAFAVAAHLERSVSGWSKPPL